MSLFDPFARLRRPSLIKTLVAIKLGLIIGIWVALSDGFFIGDRTSRAQDAPTAASKTVEAKNSDEEKSDSPKRRSFLDDLLNLPKIDPGSVKKDELGRFFELAERKQQQINDRLNLLKKREEQLKTLEGAIDKKLAQLDEERHFFAQTVQQEKDLKGKRTDELVDLYAKMDPKKAAPVFEQLDRDLVVQLFKALPKKQITAILEVMDPKKSVEITEYFGRVRSAREYDLLKDMNMSLQKEFADCKGMPADDAHADAPAH